MTDEGFYTKKQLREVCGLSNSTVDRLERKNAFPRRLKISSGASNAKVGWPKKAVHAWCAEKVAASSLE